MALARSLNLPTQLTLLRIVMTFVIMGLLFVPGWAAKVAALGAFAFASFTDWLDGYLARRWHQVSALGALLDPIADKVLVLGLFLAFVQLHLIPAWMVLIIVLRELVITGVRLYAASRDVVLSAAMEGKHKTVSQMVTILLVLVFLIARDLVGTHALLGGWAAVMRQGILGCLWVTMVLTVVSGASFFWRHQTVLRNAINR